MPRPSNAYFNLRMNKKHWRHKRVTCPQCLLNLTLGDYESHMSLCHKIDLRTQCPFCCGYFEWSVGEKCSERVGLHCLECLKHLCKPPKRKLSTPPPSSPEPPIDDCCSDSLQQGFERHMGGRVKHEEWTDFYDDVGREPEFLTHINVPNFVRFSKESGLGHEIHAILYAYLQEQFCWYHSIVKAEAWSEFTTYIASQPYVYFLPYWTLCDGRKKNHTTVSEAQRHHRHMILLVEKKRQPEFAWLWRKRVKLANVYAKWHRQIQTPFQLMNVLFYVSTPRAQCDGNPKHWDKGYESNAMSHYWIRRQMYRHAKFPMAGLIPNGYKDWVFTRVQNMDVPPWYTHVTRKHKKMQLQIKHFNLTPHGCVLPFERDIRLSHAVIRKTLPKVPFLYHYEPNKYWVLEEHVAELETLPFHAWCEHQREKGNAFVDLLEPYQYELNKHLVNSVNQVTKAVNNLLSMHKEATNLWEKELGMMKSENASLCLRWSALKQELDDHKQKHKRELKDQKQKQVEMEQELEDQKQKQVALERELEDQKQKQVALERELEDHKEKQVALERELEDHKQKHERESNDHKEKQVQLEQELANHKRKLGECARELDDHKRKLIATGKALDCMRHKLIEVQACDDRVVMVITDLANAKQQLQEYL